MSVTPVQSASVPGEIATGTDQAKHRPRVLILGAGFGGLNAAMALRRAPVEVTVIDRRNYHLFQPLLYQVATAGLSPAQIAMPIRRILSRQSNATVLMDKVEAVDTAARCVVTSSRRIPYDYLIVATGARHTYFGNDSWVDHAPGLKTITDATAIRARILSAFERAEVTDDPRLRQKLLTFVVVGGGPTGVELAGAIAELARRTIVHDFRRIDSSSARVVLVEAGERILPAMPPCLSRKAQRQLERLGVEVVLGNAVAGCDDSGVRLADGAEIGSACILWAAGVMASRAAKWIAAPADRAGRVIVDERLNPPGHGEIFVIGDTASVTGADGRPVPGWRQRPSRWVATRRGPFSTKWQVGNRRHSITVTTAISRPSAARQPSPISAEPGSLAFPHGSSGTSPISGSSSASATASWCFSTGRSPISATIAPRD